MRSRTFSLDGQELDIYIHENMIKLALFLKKNLFKRLLTQQTMYQMIYQHLIHFERYPILQSLLREEILEKYIIDYSMIEIVVIEAIHSLFSSSDTYDKIEDDVDRLLGVLTTTTLESINVTALVDIAKLLKSNKIPVDPQRLIKNINVSLLYTVADIKLSVDFEKLYELILQVKEPTLEAPNIETRDLIKFKAWLAKKYYDKGLNHKGLEMIKDLAVHRTISLCNGVIDIIEAHPSSADTLLEIGFSLATTDDQFEFLRGKYQASRKEKPLKHFNCVGSDLVNNEDTYKNAVAECKFNDPSLKNPIFETFFMLLANNHKQAFYYAYKRQLPIAQLDFFLKACEKYGIIHTYKIIEYVFKALVAKNMSKVLGLETSFKDFNQQLSEAMPRLSKCCQQLKENKEVDPVEVSLLAKYHSMAEVRCCVS